MKILITIGLIISFSAQASTCGLTGSIDERIKSCNLQKNEFILVTRTDKNLEIYKDAKTGLLWGDRISSDFNHYGSQKACDNDLLEAALLKDFNWRLPSVHEFEVAASHGMKEALPRMFHTFWTSTPVKVKSRRRRNIIPSQAFLWDGEAQRTDTGDLKDGASVRCVAKP